MCRQSCWRVLSSCALLCFAAAGSHAEPVDPPLPESKWRQWQTGALRPDRLQHASLSMSAAVGIGLVSESPWTGFAGSALLGIGKELIDTRTSHFDWGDLGADLIGAGLGTFGAAVILP